MSASAALDEDTELRDLVAQTLEANGVLGKIRAQLRASVFLALEEQESVKNKTPLQNAELIKFTSTKEGLQVVGLVREFLQFFNLDYTLAVFDPETGCVDQCQGRDALIRDLNLKEVNESQQRIPLLSRVVQRLQSGGGGGGTGNGSTAERQLLQKSADEVDSRKQAANHVAAPTAKAAPLSNHSAASSLDQDDDSFFDDFNNRSQNKSIDLSRSNKPPTAAAEVTKSAAAAPAAAAVAPPSSAVGGGASSMSSLAGLPSLGTSASKPQPSSAAASTDGNKPAFGKRVSVESADGDDDYDEDFQTSCISPIGQTPRSARSDRNTRTQSSDPSREEEEEEDEVQEEILEDISTADDLFKDESSVNGDMTTDRTVSPTGQSAMMDYLEDVLHP